VGSFNSYIEPAFRGDLGYFVEDDETRPVSLERSDTHVVARNVDDGGPRWSHAFGMVVTPPLVVGDRVFVVDFDGTVSALDASTGQVTWRDSTGTTAITDRTKPVTDNAIQLLGMAEAHGVLAVPVGNRITVFG